MTYSDKFLRSRGIVVSRDREVVIMKVLKNLYSYSIFKLGGGICTDIDNSLRGIILELSIKFVRIMLIDIAHDIKKTSILYTSNQVLNVIKGESGLIYNGVGLIVGNWIPKTFEDEKN